MRKPIFFFITFGLGLVIFAQEIKHETIVVNIEVPVRVFKGDKFVDNLTIDDFEVYEDGKLQEIVAVYLIKKAIIERKEEVTKKKFAPEVSRNFIFVFEIRDYLQKIDEVLDYFFNNILLPEDTFKVVTPIKTYGIKKNAFDRLSKQEIANQLKGILRKDVYAGSADHRSFCADLDKVLNTEGLEGDLKLSMSMEILTKLKELSYFNESKLLELSNKLKQTEGQKLIFLFYQKETLPIPTFFGPEERLQLKKDISFSVEKIKRAFSDSSILCHFLFVNKIPMYVLDITREVSFEASEIKMEDSYAEIFSAFSEMAKATGGLIESSANAAFAFQKAVDASENYYLLYYSPSSYKKDGKFKEIRVQVKNKNYRITHRAGYFAD